MSRCAKLRFVTFLTFVRFPLVLAFFVAAILHVRQPSTALFVGGLAVLIASAVTDMFDGYFARRFGVVTRFGEHADPLMDKFFYVATFPLLVFVAAKDQHTMHAVILLVLTLLFLTRDQWVTFLRALGALYNVSGGSHWSGKLRTIINFPLICAIYYLEEAPESWPFIPVRLIYTFEGIAFVINVVSLYLYTSRYWPCLRKSTSMDEEIKAP